MSRFTDLTGRTFGRLTVIGFDGYKKRANGQNRGYWKCICQCGNETSVTTSSLNYGQSKSCGCLRLEKLKESHTIHGGSYSRLYRIWHSMKQRCYYNGHLYFKYYGGRGITICDEWLHDFKSFNDWAMSNGYNDNLTIDRIDNAKGYSPQNCRWVTMKEQNQNKRPRKRVVKNALII